MNNRKELNEQVRAQIIRAVTAAKKRPIETRALTERITKRIAGATAPRVWGNLSTLKRRGAIRFPVAKRGGKSYITL